MAKIVVLSQQGIEPAVGRYDYLIQGDPSVLGLAAAVSSLAIQVDSAVPFAQWQKLTTSDNGWSLVSQSANAGATSSSGAYRASAYSVPVDGTTDATAALNTLTGTTMPQTGGPYPIVIGPNETIRTNSNITFGPTVQIQSTGGLLKPAASTTLTLNAQPLGYGKMFDTSLGGTVVMGAQGAVVKPIWWGADKTGVADSTAAVTAAFKANAGLNAGKVSIESGTYLLNSQVTLLGDNYGYLVIEGDGPGSLLLNGNIQNAQGVAMLDIRGVSQYGLKQVRVRHLRLAGASSTDQIRLMTFDQAENVRINDVYMENNGSEGFLSNGENQLRRVTIDNCHAYNVGNLNGSAAFNFNAQIANYSNCTTDNCGNGIETAGRFTSINNCIFYNNVHYGVMFNSTWSGYLDQYASYAEVNVYGGIIQGCQFINSQGYGLYIPDYFGHTNTDPVHTSPAHLDGSLGHILIQNNFFDRCEKPINGGSDLYGPIECSTNDISGQWGVVDGNDYAVSPMAGTWNIHNNQFSKGKGSLFSALVGYAYGTANPLSRITFLDNQVTNRCWNLGAFMAAFYRNGAAVGKTRFVDLDGTIAANPGSGCYRFSDVGFSSASDDLINFADFDWADATHVFSLYYEPSVIPTKTGVLPPNWSYKPGDIVTNKSPSAPWTTKRCTVGGTLNATPLAITATGTSGATTVTLTDATKVGKYQWISFPAIPTVTNKQILSISGNVVTIQSSLEATVTAGSAVNWATPVFVADRDLNTMTLPAQATGDIPYASSATALTRLAKGLNGQTLSLASGVPAWISALPRVDSGNSSTAITLTYTDAAPLQKVTLTAAAPVITIAGIPSGGYFEVDVFQDATGGRAPTWTAPGAPGGIFNWTNGNVAPTITPTASVSDRIVIHNDGSRYIANVVWQNA